MTATTTATAAALASRFEALNRFARLVWPHRMAGGPEPVGLEGALALSERASSRLRLTGGATVAALAGATGTGKSSLFNALARMQLSAPGHLRPTTAEAHACVWGADSADALLDWLRIGRRFRRESLLDARDEAPLHGLVLLDLPDMDSVATRHRVETDRLIGVVDLVVWVLDPQKYADQTVHDEYLSQMGPLHDVTVVVFNQTDRLSPADVASCRNDLARLVEADGMAGVPILTTSAVTGAGVDELRTLLEKAVSGRHAALARLEGELDAALHELSPLVRTPPGPAADLSPGDVATLGADLATAAGVSATAVAAGERALRRADVPGWPIRSRRARAVGPRADRPGGDRPGGDRPKIEPAAIRASLRELGARASAGLPPFWADRVNAVAIGEQGQVEATLPAALAAAEPSPARSIGWVLARGLWWLGLASLLVGAGWWVWYAFASDAVLPTVGGIEVPTVLVVAGAALALLVVLIGRPLAAWQARRVARRTAESLQAACLSVASEAAEPMRVVLRDDASARDAYAEATGALSPEPGVTAST